MAPVLSLPSRSVISPEGQGTESPEGEATTSGCTQECTWPATELAGRRHRHSPERGRPTPPQAAVHGGQSALCTGNTTAAADPNRPSGQRGHCPRMGGPGASPRWTWWMGESLALPKAGGGWGTLQPRKAGSWALLRIPGVLGIQKIRKLKYNWKMLSHKQKLSFGPERTPN